MSTFESSRITVTHNNDPREIENLKKSFTKSLETQREKIESFDIKCSNSVPKLTNEDVNEWFIKELAVLESFKTDLDTLRLRPTSFKIEYPIGCKSICHILSGSRMRIEPENQDLCCDEMEKKNLEIISDFYIHDLESITSIQHPGNSTYQGPQIDRIDGNSSIKDDHVQFLSFYLLKWGNDLEDMIVGVPTGVDVIECLGAQMNMLVIFILVYYIILQGF